MEPWEVSSSRPCPIILKIGTKTSPYKLQPMTLKLNRPLCFFDLETTGVNVTKDRIIEIAVLKLHPDGTKEDKVWRVNPECPIPAQVSAVHGIYDDDVANEPNFKTLSKTIYNFIKIPIWPDIILIVLTSPYWQRRCSGLRLILICPILNLLTFKLFFTKWNSALYRRH